MAGQNVREPSREAGHVGIREFAPVPGFPEPTQGHLFPVAGRHMAVERLVSDVQSTVEAVDHPPCFDPVVVSRIFSQPVGTRQLAVQRVRNSVMHGQAP